MHCIYHYGGHLVSRQCSGWLGMFVGMYFLFMFKPLHYLHMSFSKLLE